MLSVYTILQYHDPGIQYERYLIRGLHGTLPRFYILQKYIL